MVSEIELARLFDYSLQSHWEREESGPIPHCWFAKKEKDLPVPRESAADAETLAICNWTGEALVGYRIPSNLRVRKAMF